MHIAHTYFCFIKNHSSVRYTGSMLSNGSNFDDEDPLEAADLPKSFYRLDVGSDSEGSSLPRSLGGVSGAGQSNLSTEVAALIQSEMASQSRFVFSFLSNNSFLLLELLFFKIKQQIHNMRIVGFFQKMWKLFCLHKNCALSIKIFYNSN